MIALIAIVAAVPGRPGVFTEGERRVGTAKPMRPVHSLEADSFIVKPINPILRSAFGVDRGGVNGSEVAASAHPGGAD